MIALAAPTGFKYTTQEYGNQGEVNDSGPFSNFGGSSAATAVVSGLAADVKSLYLSQGNTWINNPGRLQTVMLAMTDRHFDTTTAQRTTGADPIYGFGRVKLRRFGASGATGA